MQSKWGILKLFLSAHKGLSLTTAVAALLASVLTILIPISLGKYYDLLFNVHSFRVQMLDVLPTWWWDSVPRFLVFLITIVILRSAFEFIQRFSTGQLGEMLVKNLREKLFSHQLLVVTEVYDQAGTGKYLLRYSGDLKSIQNYFTAGLIRFGSDVVLLLAAMGVIFWLNSTIALLVSLNVLFVLGVLFFLNKSLYRVSARRRDIRSGLLSFTNERLFSLLSIKAFNKQATEENKFKKRSDRLYQAGLRYQVFYNFIFTIVPGLLYLILAEVLLVAYIFRSSLSLGPELLSFILLLITLLPVFRRVLRVGTIWKVGSLSFEKLIKVLNLKTETDNRQLAKFKFKQGLIELKDVGFAYREGKPIIQNFSALVSPGITLIQGRSASGKATLIKIIAGLYAPTFGQVLIDGQDIQTLEPKSLRKKLTIVSEEFSLLGKTVFEAVSYSRKEKKRPKAQAMLDVLQHGLAPAKCLGLDDLIGEYGSHLSAGQKKLLMFTRTFLTAKPIILIEKPFDDIDTACQKNIVSVMEDMKLKGTTFILFSAQPVNQLKVDRLFYL